MRSRRGGTADALPAGVDRATSFGTCTRDLSPTFGSPLGAQLVDVTPGAGWAFTVVRTGQDGFSPDQARGFQPTPQPFQFGVCAAASADPHCTFKPGAVPKAMDVVTPAGTAQSDELDYTAHSPVTLAPVVVP